MPPKAIKVSEENYRWLSQLAGELQKMRGEPISLDEALGTLRSKPISDLAGSWKMSEKEAERLKRKIKGGWKKWKVTSA